MTVLDEIATELGASQEKYGDDHDDNHIPGDLARAGACVALGAFGATYHGGGLLAKLWPWLPHEWTRHTSGRMQRALLIRAAGLIVSEVERIDRANDATRNVIA